MHRDRMVSGRSFRHRRQEQEHRILRRVIQRFEESVGRGFHEAIRIENDPYFRPPRAETHRKARSSSRTWATSILRDFDSGLDEVASS
jgi:hypothetical protein